MLIVTTKKELGMQPEPTAAFSFSLKMALTPQSAPPPPSSTTGCVNGINSAYLFYQAQEVLYIS